MYKTQGNSKNEIFTATFTIEELEESIMKTKAKKQPGPDGIFPEFIRNLEPVAKEKLLEFYNNVWEGKFSVPSDWKKSNCHPNPKSKQTPEINQKLPANIIDISPGQGHGKNGVS